MKDAKGETRALVRWRSRMVKMAADLSGRQQGIHPISLLRLSLCLAILCGHSASQAETKEQIAIKRPPMDATTSAVFSAYVQYIDEALTAHKKGELPQPKTPPPDKGEICVSGFGWTKPSWLETIKGLNPLPVSGTVPAKGNVEVELWLTDWQWGDVIGHKDSEYSPYMFFVKMRRLEDRWSVDHSGSLAPAPQGNGQPEASRRLERGQVYYSGPRVPNSYQRILLNAYVGRTFTFKGRRERHGQQGIYVTTCGAPIWIEGLEKWPDEGSEPWIPGPFLFTGTLVRKDDLEVFRSIDPEILEPGQKGVPVPFSTDLNVARQRFLLRDAKWEKPDP